MKISDFVFRFPPIWRTANDGICRVRVFYSAQHGVTALLTDLGSKNTGPSVTNSVEKIQQALVRSGHIDRSANIIEHYEESFGGAATYSLVTFRSDGSPIWDEITVAAATELTDSSVGELAGKVSDNPRVYDQVEQISNAIDPFFDSPEPEPPSVINRRSEIRENSITKSEILALVATGANERTLQTLLKRDLSLFGEVYAHPDEEYICFSEFPIADGFVDFAIFTNRSVMEVILVEIKGADFALLNRDSYGSIAAKINTAAQQIRTRITHISRTYSDFRQDFHRIREAVESGTQLHNSLVGPQGALQVDPNKDINVRGVVIGGRTRNDVDESLIRHQFEYQTKPPVRIESWDSWLKKLRRE